jgi:hypothetical protein
MKLLNGIIDYLQVKFPPNRIVVLLTPLVFVPAAGYISAWVAKQIPGVDLDPALVSGVFVAGALSAVAAAYKWLDGWQEHEQINAAYFKPKRRSSK